MISYILKVVHSWCSIPCFFLNGWLLPSPFKISKPQKAMPIETVERK